LAGCSEDPDVKGTETETETGVDEFLVGCSEDPDVKGTETLEDDEDLEEESKVAARIPM